MIKIVELVNGTNLIAECEETETSWKLKDIVSILFAPDNKGVGFGALNPFINPAIEVEIQKDHVLFTSADMDEGILEEYKKKFGKILLPNSGLILG